MFAVFFLVSLFFLGVGITGHMHTMYLAYRAMRADDEPDIARFFIFAPMAIFGAIGAITAVILRHFEVIS